MTIAELRESREAVPFVPFTIHLANGRTHYIRHRDYLSMPPGEGRSVWIYKDSDAWSILDACLITELTFERATPQAAAGTP